MFNLRIVCHVIPMYSIGALIPWLRVQGLRFRV